MIYYTFEFVYYIKKVERVQREGEGSGKFFKTYFDS